jgi:hypothetical protein
LAGKLSAAVGAEELTVENLVAGSTKAMTWAKLVEASKGKYKAKQKSII